MGKGGRPRKVDGTKCVRIGLALPENLVAFIRTQQRGFLPRMVKLMLEEEYEKWVAIGKGELEDGELFLVEIDIMNYMRDRTDRWYTKSDVAKAIKKKVPITAEAIRILGNQGILVVEKENMFTYCKWNAKGIE